VLPRLSLRQVKGGKVLDIKEAQGKFSREPFLEAIAINTNVYLK